MSDIPIWDLLPEQEVQLTRLYFVEKKSQVEIAVLFGVTQAAIGYRLERVIKKLQWTSAHKGVYLGRPS